jgi:hypothetical protein
MQGRRSSSFHGVGCTIEQYLVSNRLWVSSRCIFLVTDHKRIMEGLQATGTTTIEAFGLVSVSCFREREVGPKWYSILRKLVPYHEPLVFLN